MEVTAATYSSDRVCDDTTSTTTATTATTTTTVTAKIATAGGANQAAVESAALAFETAKEAAEAAGCSNVDIDIDDGMLGSVICADLMDAVAVADAKLSAAAAASKDGRDEGTNMVPTIAGIALGVVVLIAVVAVLFARSNHAAKAGNIPQGVAFENPLYGEAPASGASFAHGSWGMDTGGGVGGGGGGSSGYMDVGDGAGGAGASTSSSSYMDVAANAGSAAYMDFAPTDSSHGGVGGGEAAYADVNGYGDAPPVDGSAAYMDVGATYTDDEEV